MLWYPNYRPWIVPTLATLHAHMTTAAAAKSMLPVLSRAKPFLDHPDWHLNPRRRVLHLRNSPNAWPSVRSPDGVRTAPEPHRASAHHTNIAQAINGVGVSLPLHCNRTYFGNATAQRRPPAVCAANRCARIGCGTSLRACKTRTTFELRAHHRKRGLLRCQSARRPDVAGAHGTANRDWLRCADGSCQAGSVRSFHFQRSRGKRTTKRGSAAVKRSSDGPVKRQCSRVCRETRSPVHRERWAKIENRSSRSSCLQRASARSALPVARAQSPITCPTAKRSCVRRGTNVGILGAIAAFRH